MSTKVTMSYAIPSEHGEDFHLYYDYADMDVHLEINGREILLPSRLRAWLYNVWRLEQTLEGLYLQAKNPDLLYAGPLGTWGDQGDSDLHDPLSGLDIPEVRWL